MDLYAAILYFQPLIFGLGLFFLSAILIMGIVKLTMNGNSYEDVVAEQRNKLEWIDKIQGPKSANKKIKNGKGAEKKSAKVKKKKTGANPDGDTITNHVERSKATSLETDKSMSSKSKKKKSVVKPVDFNREENKIKGIISDMDSAALPIKTSDGVIHNILVEEKPVKDHNSIVHPIAVANLTNVVGPEKPLIITSNHKTDPEPVKIDARKKKTDLSGTVSVPIVTKVPSVNEVVEEEKVVKITISGHSTVEQHLLRKKKDKSSGENEPGTNYHFFNACHNI